MVRALPKTMAPKVSMEPTARVETPGNRLAHGAAHGQDAANPHEHATDGMVDEILEIDEPLDTEAARNQGPDEGTHNHPQQRQLCRN